MTRVVRGFVGCVALVLLFVVACQGFGNVAGQGVGVNDRRLLQGRGLPVVLERESGGKEGKGAEEEHGEEEEHSHDDHEEEGHSEAGHDDHEEGEHIMAGHDHEEGEHTDDEEEGHDDHREAEAEHDHEEEGHEEHDHGTHVDITAGDIHDEHAHDEHGHDASETPVEHILLTWGARGEVITEELGFIFKKLNAGSSSKKDHAGHNHGHDHGSGGLTPMEVVEKYGANGALDEQGLIDACPMMLNCQLDDECSLNSEIVETETTTDSSAVVMLKIVSAGVLFLEVIVGGLVPVVVGQFERLSLWLSLLNSFSGGIFMGAGFIHMLPEVQEFEHRIEGLNEYPLGANMVVAGFLLIFLIEHIICGEHHGTQAKSTPRTSIVDQNPIKAVNDLARSTKRAPGSSKQVSAFPRGPLVLMLAISVHSLFEALALGLETDQNGVLLLFATIGSHKGVAAMALSARFARENATKKQIFTYLGLFALVAPLGILSGIWVSNVPDLVSLILNGLAAGTFIYIGAYEVINDEFGTYKEGEPPSFHVYKYGAVVGGVLLMSLLQIIPHDH